LQPLETETSWKWVQRTFIFFVEIFNSHTP
jgi:hypothetical protein